MACLIAAVASLLRGKRYIHELDSESALEASADVAAGTEVADEAGAAPVGVAAAAEIPARVRVAVAEAIREPSDRRAGSPEPAMRTFNER